MDRVLFNIGCGNKKIGGFINIDLDPAADMKLDVTKGLPFENNSVHGIFSEHFFEHITQAQGAAFLRECRRILVPGGVCRIATPDLDSLVCEYSSDQWLNQEWGRFGYNYLDNRCEMLNLAMREWEHKWVYNEEELVRLAELAGFTIGGRYALGESPFAFFRGLECREGSGLIMEFIKMVRAVPERPLVSILIPSYKPAFFRDALESALAQTYQHTEIIVTDDCPTDAIEACVASYADSRIRYTHNLSRLGSYNNYVQAFSFARGEYIKFLNDDDLLHPTCVDRMVNTFADHPEVTLVTSHRQCIDERGNELPDIPPTKRIVEVDSLFDGVAMANEMLNKQMNFIGEPTTVMFRKTDLASTRPNILSFGGRQCVTSGDMSIWANLLSKGDAIYLADTLSYFRQHAAQEQRQAAHLEVCVRALSQLMFDAKRFGFLSEYNVKRTMSQPIHIKSGNELQVEAIVRDTDTERVIVRLEQLLRNNSNIPNAHNELGVRYYERGEKEKALNAFKQAMVVDSTNLNAARNLAGVALELERIEDAMLTLQSILNKVPNDAEALMKLGHVSCTIQRFEDAVFFYQRVLACEPQNREAQELLDALRTKGFGIGKQDSESKSEPVVSIIIPVFNKVEYTRQCISALEKVPPSCRYEIIVIDNASSDGTKEYLEQMASTRTHVQVMRNERNLGFARACNQGAQRSRGQYVLFLNNDTEPQEEWCDALLTILENDSSVAAAGSKLVYADGTIQHAGVVISDDRQIGDPLLARHAYVGQPTSLPEANTPRTYQALTAACLLVRKSAFNEVGGLDEEYWNGYEDVDLCFTLRAKGWKLVYQPASVVIHYESQSGPERMRDVSRNIQRLHQRWRGKITPDIIITEDGRSQTTESVAISEYTVPQCPAKLVSIIILTYNNLAYTKECFASIQSHTRYPYEVIFVDNASTDNTVEWLRDIENATNNCRLILNDGNLGFPAGNNRALAVARGEYVLLLNNDVVVTEGWLERLFEVAESDSTIGIVGPISNYVSGPQIDKAATYKTMDAMHAYAKSVCVRNKGEIMHFPRVAFLCTLIKRDLLTTIGGLDERFSPGNFEDDDFCLRANLAGFKTVIAKDVFIHHYGSKSFLADGAEDYNARLATNGKIFAEKWGVDNGTLWTQGKGVKKHSLRIPIHHDLFVQYFEQAQIHIEEKEMRLGLDALVKALSSYHMSERATGIVEYTDVLDIAANVALALGDLQKAKEFFEEELKREPHSSRACTGLGEIFYLAEMDQASKTMFEHAVVNDDENVAAINGLAKANRTLGLPDDDNSLFVLADVSA